MTIWSSVRDSAPTLTTTYNFKTTTYFLEESLSSRGPHRYKYTPAALPQFVQRLDDYLHQTNDQSPRPARVLDKQLLVAAQPTRRYDQLKVNMPTFSPFGGQISVNEKAPLQQYDGLNVAMPSASRIHSSAAPVVEVAPRYNGLNFDVPTLSLFRSPTYPATKAAPTGSDHMNSSMSTFNVLSKLTSQLNGQTSTTKGPKYTCPGHRDPSKTPTRAPMVPTSATSSSSTLLKNDFESETNFEVYVPLCPYRLTQPPSAIPPTALRHRPSDLEGENKLDLYPIGRMRIRKRPSPSSCTDQSEPALKRRCPKENQSNRSYLQQIAEETNQQLSCTPLPSGRTPLPSGRNPLSFGCTPVPSGRTPMPSGRTSLPMGEENLAQTGSFLNSWNVRQPWNISPNNLNLSNAAGASRGDSGVNDSGYNNVGVFELVEFLPQKVHDEVFAHHLQLAPPSNLVNWLTRGLIPKQVLDEVVAQHLRTAPAKDIVNWLARAGRLGFTEKDMVDEDLDAILHADDGLHVNENPTVDELSNSTGALSVEPSVCGRNTTRAYYLNSCGVGKHGNEDLMIDELNSATRALSVETPALLRSQRSAHSLSPPSAGPKSDENLATSVLNGVTYVPTSAKFLSVNPLRQSFSFSSVPNTQTFPESNLADVPTDSATIIEKMIEDLRRVSSSFAP